MAHSILSDLPVLPLAESFALTEAYNLDTFPEKVNLGQGVYRDEECQPWILPSVRSAEEYLHRQRLNHEYLPIQGAAQFTKEARNLLFSPQLAQNENITSVQTVAGTGANHLAALFCARYLRPKNVFISDPTWDNHHLIWETAGPDIKRKLYPYYDPLTRSLDFNGMIAELENSAEENDVVILHACAHNPTGIDPTHTQWEKIAEIVAKKRLFVIFDSAYQGFASGDLDADAWAIRYFYSTLFGDASLPTSATPAGMLVCQSFSKNFGLYGERIGALHLVTPPSVPPQGAYTHLVRLIRAEISCPSLFGERCVHTILTDLELRSKWEEDVKTMASRIQGVRMSLKSELENIGAQGNWDHIGSQIGMFSYTGLSKTQVHRLKEVHHVYMLGNGRMSLSGLNGKNVAYVARAIKEVVDRD
ncbi:unnamed protein product [Penicillium crustosum]